MKYIRAAVARLGSSAVFWAWGFNGIRVGSGLLLLPLLLHRLTREDLGYFFVLQNLFAIVPLIDFGIAVSVARHVSYAMGGASEAAPHGVVRASGDSPQPNHSLVWKLMDTTRTYYRILSIGLLVLMGGVSVTIACLAAGETSSPLLAWVATGVALLSLVFEVYWGWWNTFLAAMNCVQASARISFAAYSLRFVLACGLLLAGGGVASVFLAGFVSSFMMRWAARRECLRILPIRTEPALSRKQRWDLLKVLWPNSWRVGVQLLSGYLAVNANSLLCLQFFGLSTNAQYGLSVQVAFLIQSVSAVWTSVKLPMVSQLRVRGDHATLRLLLRPRFLLQSGTFVVGAIFAVLAGPALIEWITPDKHLLPVAWLALVLAQAFFDMQVTFWTTFIATENRVPSVWPVTLSNCMAVALALLFLHFTTLNVGSLALPGLIVGSLFNYWYWPLAGARNLKTTWWRFLFHRPPPSPLPVAS